MNLCVSFNSCVLLFSCCFIQCDWSHLSNSVIDQFNIHRVDIGADMTVNWASYIVVADYQHIIDDMSDHVFKEEVSFVMADNFIAYFNFHCVVSFFGVL